MIEAKSFVRTATLLDMLSVSYAMNSTERGKRELEGFQLLTGVPVNDHFLAQLSQVSFYTVALVTKENPGRALVVAGFLPQRPGVLRTWMLPTDEAWRYGSELTAYTAAGINARLEENHRIETICPDSHVAAKAWYPKIGLKQESTLAKYCSDGSDAALFVRLRESV